MTPPAFYDAKSVRDLIVRPSLSFLGLPGGEVAERLVLATAAYESEGFLHDVQVGGGPARSFWQIERATFLDLWRRYVVDWVRHSPSSRSGSLLAYRLGALALPDVPAIDQLATNPFLAAGMCRIKYFDGPFAMPIDAAPEDLALIYKQHYNTSGGMATPEAFLAAYHRHVAPLYPEGA